MVTMEKELSYGLRSGNEFLKKKAESKRIRGMGSVRVFKREEDRRVIRQARCYLK